MKRITFLKSLFLLCALIVGSGTMWATDLTLNLADNTGWSITKSGTSGTGSEVIMSKDGITITASKGYIDSGVSLRVYQGSTFVVTSSIGNMSSIVLTYTGGKSGPITNYTNGTATISPASDSYSQSASGQARISQMVVTYTASSSDPSSNVSFANATPSMDLKDATSFTQTATTAEGYAETASASVTYEITANTAGATIDENTGEVIPTQTGSVTVTATAAAIEGHYSGSTASYTLTVTDTRTFTITCHIGNNTSTVDRTSGETLGLDNPASILGMTFVGWSSSNDVESPVWVANSTIVTGDIVLYAIYQAEEGEYSYHLVETDQSDWRGDYLIAYSEKIFADGRVSGTGSGGIGASGISVKPGAKLDGKIVDVDWGDSYSVVLEAVDNADLTKGYLMKTKDGVYNYQTSNANGIATSANRSTAAASALSVTFNSSSNIAISIEEGAIFHYNTSGYFRFYANGTQSPVYLYKRTTDVEPVYSLGLTVGATITTAEYATFSSSHATDFSSTGITPYTATDKGTSVKLNEITTGKVPANTPVVLYKAGADGTAIDVPVIASADAPAGTNDLRISTGTDVENMFVLAKKNNKVGFYKWAGSSDLSAGKVYLLGQTTNARDFLGFDQTSTSISAIDNSQVTVDENAPTYNLAGQRVNKSYKGVVIVNGKKVVRK